MHGFTMVLAQEVAGRGAMSGVSYEAGFAFNSCSGMLPLPVEATPTCVPVILEPSPASQVVSGP